MPVSPSPARPTRSSSPRAYAALRPGSVQLSRRAAFCLGGLTVAALGWALATTWYIAARDEVAQLFFARQTEMEYAYEDQISALKAKLEREVTGHLVERNGVDARVAALADRQAAIESRQAWLRSLAERPALSGAMISARAAPRPAALPAAALGFAPAERDAPLPEPFALRLRDPGDEGTATPIRSVPADPAPARRDRLSAVERSLATVAADELRTAQAFRQAAEERVRRLRNVLAATGLDPERLGRRPAPVGGPLVPLPPGLKEGPFGPLAAEAEARLAELERLQEASRRLPLARPLPGELEQTSGFGVRIDPFTRGAAMHTGVDFRAEYGAPVRTTASGRVVSAEWSGGYGNLVEIDHGGGVATRYGHLSGFAITPGEQVEAGQIVGRAGSTGRSTGSHLHYETRINGEAVNPERFLQAAALLTADDTPR